MRVRSTPHVGSPLLGMVLLMGCGALVGDQATVGGETHFLVTCEQGCGDGLACIEGVCTRGCEPGYSSCTELAAEAACMAVPDDAAERVPFTGTCDVFCASDADCAPLGADHTCRARACRAAPPSEPLASTGSTQAPLVRAVAADTCRSGLRWAGGDTPSAEMHPGSDCVGCHRDTGARPLILGGTLYANADFRLPPALEDCFGLEGVELTVVDAAGRQFSMLTNRAGNFYLEGSASDLTMPYSAEIHWQNREGREQRTLMFTRPSYGGCARCHGVTGETVLPQEEIDADLVIPTLDIFTPGLYPSRP